MRLSVRNRILAGFSIILVILLVVSIVNILKINELTETKDQLTKQRYPSVLAELELTDGIHLSLAGLRGYMILGKNPAAADKFKAERQSGWQLIDNSIKHLESLSESWIKEDKERLAKLIPLIEEFRHAQQEVEDIAHAPENIRL